jgi:hypothetical protein
MVRRVNLLPSSRLFVTALCVAFCSLSSAQSTDSLRLSPISRSPIRGAQAFSLTPAPTSVASGDLNGDGHPDLVVTRVGSGSVSVLLSDGKGGFSAGLGYPAGTTVSSALVGDFNGDGKLDVAVIDSATGSVDVLFGNGDGTLGNAVVYAAIKSPIALASGSFTSSGKIDLAVASSTGLAVLLNDGAGHFSSAAAVSISSQPLSLAAADLRASGHDDLILANQDGSATVLLSDGVGHFSAQAAIPVASGPLSSVLAADLNGDGNADLAITVANSNVVSVLLGHGDGTFQSGASYTVGNGPAKVIAADLTGDGFADLVSINQLSNTFSVLLGNGDGSFRPSIDFVAGNTPLAVVAGDFNADGHADLAIANSQDQTLAVPLGRGDGTFIATPSYRADLWSKAVAAGDLNGDGRTDLVVTNYCGTDASCASNGTATIFLANADGTYRAASTIALGNGPVAVALADLNGDKKLDLIALNSADKTLSILSGSGDGAFTTSQRYSLSSSPRAVLVGDFNGDGNPDLAIASDCGQSACTQPGSLDIWFGRGDGSLAASASYTVGYGPISIAAADLRSTGHLDLVVANTCGDDSTCKSAGTATLFSNDGMGKLTQTGEISIGSAPSAIALGNLSGGGLDLAVAQRGSNQVAVLHADGKGGFSAPVNYPVGSAPSALAIADVNGDGQPDLAVANSESSTVSVLYASDGKLQSAASYPVAANPVSLVALAGRPAGIVTANGSGATPMGGGFTPLGGTGSGTTTVTFTTAAVAGTVDQQVTISGNVAAVAPAGTPTGFITFAVDASGVGTGPFQTLTDCNDGSGGETLDGSGDATCNTLLLTAGTPAVVLQYSGDTNYNTNQSTDQGETIAAAPTTVNLPTLVSPASPTVDQVVTVSATVIPSTGTVSIPFSGSMEFFNNAVAIPGCTALPVGTSTGIAQCQITAGLPEGPNPITAEYNASATDTNYGTSTSTAFSLSIGAAATSVSVSPSPATSIVDQSIILTAIIAPAVASNEVATANLVPITGSVTFSDAGTAITCTPLNVSYSAATGMQTATCATSALTAGTHSNITATTVATSSYGANASPASSPVTVSQASSSVVVTANPAAPALNQAVMFTADITFPAPLTVLPTGTVSFSDNGTTITTCGTAGITVTGTANIYSATCNDSSLTGGSHAIIATYTGDTNYATGTGTLPLSIASATSTTTVTSTPNPSTVNQSVSFTVKVQGGTTVKLTGTATVTADSANGLGQCTLSNWSSVTGAATCSVSNSALNKGTHTISASYSGDSNYGSSGGSLAVSQTVNQDTTTLGLVTSGSPSVVNQAVPVLFTATITPSSSGSVIPTGSVTFTATPSGGAAAPISGCSGVTVTSSGTASCPGSPLLAGTYTINASYTGDTNFGASNATSTVPQTVNKGTTSVGLATSGTPSQVNGAVTFTATITPTPAGNIALAGVVSFTDTPSGGATAPIANCTNVALTISGGKSVATCPTSTLILGSHNIIATYASDSNFAGSSSSVTQVVDAASSSITLASSSPLVSGTPTSSVNQTVTFTANIPVPSGSATLKGTVAFKDGAASIAGCSAVTPTPTLSTNWVASCPDPVLTAGNHSISASYGGDPNFSVQGGSLTQAVNKAATGLVASSSVDPSSVYQSVTFTAVLTAPGGSLSPNGTVNFTDSVTGASIPTCAAAPLTTTSGNTQATCTTTALTLGSHSIQAAYGNDLNFANATSSVAQTVNPAASSISLATSSVTINVNQSATFTSTITAPSSAVTLVGTETFTDTANGKVITACTNVAPKQSGATANWVATCVDSSLTAGNHTITASYSGDTNFSVSNGIITQQVLQTPSTTALTLSAGNNPSVITNPNNAGDTVTFTALVKPAITGSVALSGAVTFSDNGAVLTGCSAVPVNPGTGTANCTPVPTPATPTPSIVTLTAGVNSISAVYTEPVASTNFESSTGTFTQNVQDFGLSASTAPPVIVSQGFTTTSDSFTAQTMSVGPLSYQNFGTVTNAPLSLSCSVANSSGTTVTAPACDLYALGTTTKASTLAVSATAAQSALTLVVDATTAAPGTYTVTITGTDPTTGLVHTTSFPFSVRAVGAALGVASGATTNNTGNVTFLLPSGVTLSNFSCPYLSGSGITSVGGTKPSNYGVGCAFGTPTVSGNTVTLPVTVTTNNTIAAVIPARRSDLLIAGMFGLPVFGLIGILRRRRSRIAFFQLMGLLAVGLVALQTMGCGGSFHTSGTTVSGGTTPPGVYYLLVEGTGSDGNTYEAVLPVNVTVL